MSYNTVWTEHVTSRKASLGRSDPSAQLVLYGINATVFDDDDDANQSLLASIPLVYPGSSYAVLTYASHTCENQGGGLWVATVTYTRKDSLYTFDTGGGTQRITQNISTAHIYSAAPPSIVLRCNLSSGSPVLDSLEDTAGVKPGWTVSGDNIPDGATVTLVDDIDQDITISANATATATELVTFSPPSGAAALPGFKGAINAKDDSVEGLDVEIPVFHWEETYHVPPSFVTQQFKDTARRLTGSMNEDDFRGCLPYECKFLGLRGCEKGAEDVELTYRFGYSPERTNFKVGDIDVVHKAGWDYMEVRYKRKVDAVSHLLIQVPDKVIIHQVFPISTFADLGIGS